MKNILSIKKIRRGEAGISLIETMIALAILLIASIGILSMISLSITTTENQGHLAARTAEYAQDKMEQLLALSFADKAYDEKDRLKNAGDVEALKAMVTQLIDVAQHMM